MKWSFSLVHYRSRLTGGHIWITHAAIKESAASASTLKYIARQVEQK